MGRYILQVNFTTGHFVFNILILDNNILNIYIKD